MKKMITVWTVGPDGKPAKAAMSVISILQNPKNVRMDGIMDALRFATLDAHTKINEINELLKAIASAGGIGVPQEKRSLRPTAPNPEDHTPGTDGPL
jgi:hypothetical protein